MIHYESGEKEIVKYDIIIDIEKLKEIREIVLEKFTEVAKISCEGLDEPVPKEGETITDLEKSISYSRGSDSPFSSSFQPTPINRYKYISYQAPRLIYLIDQLISGNGSIQVIRELKLPQEKVTKKETLEEKINSMFPVQITTNFDQLISYLSEYKEYVSLNEGRLQFLEKSEILSYYPRVLECVQITEISRIPNGDLKGIIEFFEGELDIVLDELALIKQNCGFEDISPECPGKHQKKIGNLQ